MFLFPSMYSIKNTMSINLLLKNYHRKKGQRAFAPALFLGDIPELRRNLDLIAPASAILRGQSFGRNGKGLGGRILGDIHTKK